MKNFVASVLFTALLVAPSAAFADYTGSLQTGRTQVATLSQQQLDGLNTRVFSDAFLTAKIIGFDRSEIDQLKAAVQELKSENTQLRAQLNQQPSIVIVAPGSSSSLETRVAYLEVTFAGLQKTLGLVVNMLTLVLAKL